MDISVKAARAAQKGITYLNEHPRLSPVFMHNSGSIFPNSDAAELLEVMGIEEDDGSLLLRAQKYMMPAVAEMKREITSGNSTLTIGPADETLEFSA